MNNRSNPQAVSAYIGLGSNIGSDADKLIQMQRAVNEIKQLPGTSLIQVASLYRSEAWGVPDQPDFFNSAALIKTALSAEELLTAFKDIENKLGRQKRDHWGPREIDLDILLYGTEQINTPRLTIPHPHLLARDFVVLPLLELDPQLKLPNNQILADAAPIFQLGQSIGKITSNWIELKG